MRVTNAMKPLLRLLVPDQLIHLYRVVRRRLEQRRNRGRTTEQVFTLIYEHHKWGGEGNELSSGSGTANEVIVSDYVAMVAQRATTEGFFGLAFVDLGCGDFRVGRLLLPLCSAYAGVDIVKPVVARNQNAYGDATTRFVQLDIVTDELPHGDVCFVRQVLQHLSNDQIARIVRKLGKYRWVFITEHYPEKSEAIRVNIDKVHGPDVRAYDNSGVYLSEPPFNVSAEAFETVLEVPGVGLGEGVDPGIIRTLLYKPRR